MYKQIVVAFIVFSCLSGAKTQTILPLRQQAQLQNDLLADRLDNLLPTIMRKAGIDMWVIIASEYNEDPITSTILPATWLHARRRTIFLLTDEGATKGVEKLAVARYDIGTTFKSAWNPETEPNQWKRLADLIAQRSPKKIGINSSPRFAHADGLSKAEADSFMQYLPANYKQKVVSAETLAVDWLQLRTQKELVVYEQICRIGHNIISEAFSEKVIHPGITTTDDVVWWLRQRVSELQLQTWFHPTVDVQRNNGPGDSQRSFATRPNEEIILPGDLLHVDFGITYLRLNTDVQQLAYVLKPGETHAPLFLTAALATGNRLQDILVANFAQNKTGNQVLSQTIAQAKAEKITPSIYSHPIGYHGHGAGPAIGMWDMQQGVPGPGHYPLQFNTLYAIELNAKVILPGWNNKEIRVMLEEQGLFTPTGVRFVDGRQKQLILIPGPQSQLGN